MERFRWILMFALLLLAAGSALAEVTCPYPAEACLSYYGNEAPKKGWMGADLEPDETTGGYVLTAVFDEGPAAEAGLRMGDVILAVDGNRIDFKDEAALEPLIAQMMPERTFTYTFKRGSKEKKIDVTLVKIPEDALFRETGKHMLLHAQSTKSGN